MYIVQNDPTTFFRWPEIRTLPKLKTRWVLAPDKIVLARSSLLHSGYINDVRIDGGTQL